MQNYTTFANLKGDGHSLYDEHLISLLLDDTKHELYENELLVKHLLFKVKNPLCLAKRVFSLLITQKIKHQEFLKKKHIVNILNVDFVSLNSFEENLFVNSLRLYLEGNEDAVLAFFKNFDRPRDLMRESCFITHMLLVADLLDSRCLLLYAIELADLLILRSSQACFDTLYLCSEQSVSSAQVFVQAYLLCLFLSKVSPSNIQEKLTVYFNDALQKHEIHGQFPLYEAFLEHYIQSLEIANQVMKKPDAEFDFIHASVLQNKSFAIASFCYRSFYVPCIGFSGQNISEQDFLYFNHWFSSLVEDGSDKCSLIVALGKQKLSYCYLDLINMGDKFLIKALYEGHVEQKLNLFIRADCIKLDQQKILKKGGLDQFCGLLNSIELDVADKRFLLLIKFNGRVEIKPLAGGLYFWTADFMISFNLLSKHCAPILEFSEKL